MTHPENERTAAPVAAETTENTSTYDDDRTHQPSGSTVDAKDRRLTVHVRFRAEHGTYVTLCGYRFPIRRAVHHATGDGPGLKRCDTCHGLQQLDRNLDRVEARVRAVQEWARRTVEEDL